MDLQVGVKLIIHDPNGNLLLLRRTRAIQSGENIWDIPGGRIQPGEPLMDALRREVIEETGIELADEPQLIAAQDIFVGDRHIVRLTYRVTIANTTVKLSDEHSAAAWVATSDVARYQIDPYIQELLNYDES